MTSLARSVWPELPEAAVLVGVEGVGGPGGVQSGTPQRLVDEQVAEPRHPRLVHQHRLERRPAAGQHRVKLALAEREGVRAEPVLVGVELDRAQPARVAQRQRAAEVGGDGVGSSGGRRDVP